MKTITFAILATAAAAFALPANAASLTQSDDLFGHSKFNIERTLAERGVNATGLEAWGQSIRATVTNPDGTTTTQFFDKDTFRPVRSDGLAERNAVGSGDIHGRGDFGSSNNTIISQ
ncbi:MAG TPA: hypothetical protein VN155_14125 [Devosia sp.]|nr:hypothetical protein [Devosia sp.]